MKSARRTSPKRQGRGMQNLSLFKSPFKAGRFSSHMPSRPGGSASKVKRLQPWLEESEPVYAFHFSMGSIENCHKLIKPWSRKPDESSTGRNATQTIGMTAAPGHSDDRAVKILPEIEKNKHIPPKIKKNSLSRPLTGYHEMTKTRKNNGFFQESYKFFRSNWNSGKMQNRRWCGERLPGGVG